MDLMALADALLLPDDDLALATVLRSPLFGFTDDDLFDIAADRGRVSLRAALTQKVRRTRNLRRSRARARRACACGAATRRRSPSTRVVLGAGGGRRRFLARLGAEAERCARRIPQSRARLRAARDAVAARLHRLAARGARRSETRHGDRARRSARHDRARRQGPRSADRHPRRYHDAACRPAAAAAARACRTAPVIWAGRKDDDVAPVAAARQTALARGRKRISPAALRRHDARRRPADRVRRGRTNGSGRTAAGTILCRAAQTVAGRGTATTARKSGAYRKPEPATPRRSPRPSHAGAASEPRQLPPWLREPRRAGTRRAPCRSRRPRRSRRRSGGRSRTPAVPPPTGGRRWRAAASCIG